MLFSLLLLSYYVSLSFILLINGRHDIMKTISTANINISTTLEETISTALMRIFNDVTSTRKNINCPSARIDVHLTPKDKFIFVLSLSNTCCVARIGHVVLKIGKMNQNHYRTSTPPKTRQRSDEGWDPL